jgi:hypothetical protein
MQYEQVNQKIKEALLLIEIGRTGFAEANDRATKFLIIVALLGDYLYEKDMELVKLKTLKDASFCEAISEVPSIDSTGNKIKMTVTEKKTYVNGSKSYTANREAYEELEALKTWIQGNMKIFSDAHIHYRQMARNEGN